MEYKSPEDYISVNDFYKVLGYVCVYQADTRKVLEIVPEELTITLAGDHLSRPPGAASKEAVWGKGQECP